MHPLICMRKSEKWRDIFSKGSSTMWNLLCNTAADKLAFEVIDTFSYEHTTVWVTKRKHEPWKEQVTLILYCGFNFRFQLTSKLQWWWHSYHQKLVLVMPLKASSGKVCLFPPIFRCSQHVSFIQHLKKSVQFRRKIQGSCLPNVFFWPLRGPWFHQRLSWRCNWKEM